MCNQITSVYLDFFSNLRHLFYQLFMPNQGCGSLQSLSDLFHYFCLFCLGDLRSRQLFMASFDPGWMS